MAMRETESPCWKRWGLFFLCAAEHKRSSVLLLRVNPKEGEEVREWRGYRQERRGPIVE